MNTALHAANPRLKDADQPDRTRAKVAASVLAAVGLAAVTAMLALGRPGMSGRYSGVDGTSVLEFRGSRVYVTTSLGTTFVTGYEVDGNRVIIKGAGGAQVYTREGVTLDGGVGIRFVKQD